MAEPVDPLQSLEAMVDEEGRPTEYFLQQWQALIELVNTTDANEAGLEANTQNIEANSSAISDLKAIELTAGVGLDGGGDLTANRSFDLADTTVAPGTFGNATNVAQVTVDQQGRITTALNVAISGAGGGGSVIAFPSDVSTALSSSAFASKGFFALPHRAVTVSDIMCIMSADTTHTYKAGIYTLNSSLVIQTVVGESVTQVPSTTAVQYLTFPVSSLVMAVGTLHYVAVTRADSATTFALPMGIGSEGLEAFQRGGFPIEDFPTGTTKADPFGRLASISPTVGQTVLSGLGVGFLAGAIGVF